MSKFLDKIKVEYVFRHRNSLYLSRAAVTVMAAIEAGKVSLNVTSPSIEREFGVKG